MISREIQDSLEVFCENVDFLNKEQEKIEETVTLIQSKTDQTVKTIVKMNSNTESMIDNFEEV